MVIPLVVVLATAESVGGSVAGSLSTEAAERLKSGEDLNTVLNAVSDQSVILGAILLVYLAWGAAVGAVGTAMRAYAHNDDERKSLDLAGKLMAVSSAMIVAVGAIVRLVPERKTELDHWTYVIVVGLALVLVALSLGIGNRVKRNDLDAKRVKDAAKDRAIISAVVAQVTVDPRLQPKSPASRGLVVVGSTTLVVAAIVGLLRPRRP